MGDGKLKDLPVLVAGTIEAPTAGNRNTKPVAVETTPSFTPNSPIAESGGADEQPAPDKTVPDRTAPAVAQNVKFPSRTYLMGNGGDFEASLLHHFSV